jgi:transglutaminase-like putative cysteine protease
VIPNLPRVRVTHETKYHYAKPVRLLSHRLMLRPRDSHDLRLLETQLSVSPPALATRWAHDVFGNSVSYLTFPEATETTSLRIISRLDLHHYPTREDLPLDPSAEAFPFGYTSTEVPDLARSIERHYPDPERLVDAWAHRFLTQGGPTGTMAMLTAMTRAIKAEFRYEGRQAEGTNDPLVTLQTGAGACRDLALLMMEAVRSLGLAARFVSGYLYDERLVANAEPILGGGATHAWVEVYLPGAGWVEFDPTNGWIAGRNLIRVSVARTPQQAVPIAGTFLGPPGSFGSMSVNVEVAVG